MNTEKYLGWLTGLIALSYVGAAAYAFSRANITWADFSGAVGPIVGTLVGYWIRGSKA